MPIRTGRISIVFQELLTVIVRVRAGRQQISSADHFRQQIRGALATAQSEALRGGYNTAEASLAAQAVVAFLDESILNSGTQLANDWVRQPIGPEYFEQHVAGEVFFKNIRDLLTGDNSQKVSDILELYQLCLLLGYRGRFGGGREGDVRTIIDRIAEKTQRIHGSIPLLEPQWRPEGETVPMAANPWTRRLTWIAACAAGLFVALFLVYWLVLSSGVTALASAQITWGTLA
jgi:type VI secretion system protein ImpK